VAPKKPKKETVENMESINTMQENVEVKRRLRSKGWIKDPKKKKYLSELYSRSSGIKIELI